MKTQVDSLKQDNYDLKEENQELRNEIDELRNNQHVEHSHMISNSQRQNESYFSEPNEDKYEDDAHDQQNDPTRHIGNGLYTNSFSNRISRPE